MFDQTFVNTQAHARRPWTVAASLTLQTGLVAVAVILPMLHPEILRPKPAVSADSAETAAGATRTGGEATGRDQFAAAGVPTHDHGADQNS